MHQNPANSNPLFRLIAWNIRAGGGRRAEHIAQALAARKADAVILSEFRSTSASQLIAQRLAEHGLDQQYATTSEVPPGRNALLIAARSPVQKVALQYKP
ncbi:MAG: endonuclease/exonuclease/phosphatase family protein, partial [Pseudomonadota bacterium]